MSLLGTFSTASINGFQNPDVVEGPVLVQLIQSPNPRDNGAFGYSVDITEDGNEIVIGEPAGGGTSGNAYVYSRSANIWSLQTTFSAGILNDDFGFSVKFSGDGNYLAIGSSTAGRVYVYKKSGTSWGIVQTITGSATFGYSIAINFDGSYLAVSQISDNSNSGKFFIYYRASTTFALQSTQPGVQFNTNLGESLAMDDNANFVIATFNDTTILQTQGRPYITFRTGNTWSNIAAVSSGGIEPRKSYAAVSNDGTKMIYTSGSNQSTSFYNIDVGNSTTTFANTFSVPSSTGNGFSVTLDYDGSNFLRNGYFEGNNTVYLSGSNIRSAFDSTTTYKVMGDYRGVVPSVPGNAGLVYIFI